MTRTLAA
jgi:glycerol uptake facilitator-like aquaporin